MLTKVRGKNHDDLWMIFLLIKRASKISIRKYLMFLQ